MHGWAAFTDEEQVNAWTLPTPEGLLRKHVAAGQEALQKREAQPLTVEAALSNLRAAMRNNRTYDDPFQVLVIRKWRASMEETAGRPEPERIRAAYDAILSVTQPRNG